jgi:hypothetical protein
MISFHDNCIKVVLQGGEEVLFTFNNRDELASELERWAKQDGSRDSS